MATPPSTPARATAPLVPLPEPERPPWVLYVDLDAYYVSCELRDRPELRGRPVIVGRPPTPTPARGVVLSASYEARRFGVRSAMPVSTAARLCPEAVWISPDFAKYETTAAAVRRLLARFAPRVVPYSIDEAALILDLEGPEQARDRAGGIQAALREELSLPASIGAATSRTVAKIATDRAKPGGILVVPTEEIATFLAPLPVRSIPGIGPKTEESLRELGVVTIGDLRTHPMRDLERRLGGWARTLVALAEGRPPPVVEDDTGPRSRSTDRTFDADVSDWGPLEEAVRTMGEDLAASLDREGLRYGTVGIAFRWSDLSRSQRSRALPASQEGPAPLREEALRLARELWDSERAERDRPVRTVSVRVEHLEPRTQRQRSLDEAWDEPSSATP